MSEQPPQSPTEAVALLDLVAKVVVVLLLAVVVVDPAWANLEGKAPMARALTYPMLAFVVPLVWAVRADPPPYPWLPDLLLTLACFTDVLGNRLDLYDTVGWFDDLVHVAVPGILTAAFLLLTGPVQGFGRALERAIAFGLSASLAWELFEYSSHVTRLDRAAAGLQGHPGGPEPRLARRVHRRRAGAPWLAEGDDQWARLAAAPHGNTTPLRSSRSAGDIADTGDEPVDVLGARVRREAGPDGAGIAEPEPAGGLDRVEVRGRGVHADGGEVLADLPAVAAVDREEHGRGATGG